LAWLILDGNDYGPHVFIAPIRDLKTHKPFPGLDIGDIGVKFGFNMKDNGYLGFTNYKIPRDNLLMKYSSVSKDGEYKLSSDNDP